MTPHEILPLLRGVKRSSGGWRARCPAHDDHRASLSVGTGADGGVLLHCHAGCSFDAIRAALGPAASNGQSHAPLRARTPQGAQGAQRRIVATYDYRDAHGALLYQAVRYEPKGFAQRRPDGNGGWLWNLDGVRRVPYRLPELLAANTDAVVFVAEGEKDVERLRAEGRIATCNGGGAGKWRAEYNEPLRGRPVVVLPDHDAAGRRHAAQVAASLHGTAQSVRVVELPGLADKGDVSDWLEAGGTLAELSALVKAAPEWTPAAQLATPETKEERAKSSPATQLVALAREAELWHAEDGTPYATVKIGGHAENWPLRSRGFKDWLARKFYLATRRAASAQAVHDALGVLSGKARFEGPELAVCLRLAEHAGAIYLDLGGRDWRAVEITAHGWQVVSDVPVKFRRAAGFQALPLPERGGHLRELAKFANVAPDDWPLLTAWLAACFRPGYPFPVLALHGEQGSAKTTTARFLRALVDPNSTPLRSEPRSEHDLIIAANNGWLVALDNLSHLPTWLSDAICRLATGGGFSARTLYTDADETLFTTKRPVLLNGIEELATRGDLLERSIILHLPAIPPEKRRTESTIWREFEAAQPRLLGASLDAVSVALREVSHVALPELPRMADFAQWAVAAESGLGLERGAFLARYETNRAQANELALEASPVAAAVLVFLLGRDEWRGTATTLLAELTQATDSKVTEQRAWPKTPRTLSGALKRLAPNLRATGWRVEFSREGQARIRQILICRIEAENARNFASASSFASAKAISDTDTDSYARTQRRTQNTGADANSNGDGFFASAPNLQQTQLLDSDADAKDDADAKIRPYSGQVSNAYDYEEF